MTCEMSTGEHGIIYSFRNQPERSVWNRLKYQGCSHVHPVFLGPQSVQSSDQTCGSVYQIPLSLYPQKLLTPVYSCQIVLPVKRMRRFSPERSESSITDDKLTFAMTVEIRIRDFASMSSVDETLQHGPQFYIPSVLMGAIAAEIPVPGSMFSSAFQQATRAQV